MPLRVSVLPAWGAAVMPAWLPERARTSWPAAKLAVISMVALVMIAPASKSVTVTPVSITEGGSSSV